MKERICLPELGRLAERRRCLRGGFRVWGGNRAKGVYQKLADKHGGRTRKFSTYQQAGRRIPTQAVEAGMRHILSHLHDFENGVEDMDIVEELLQQPICHGAFHVLPEGDHRRIAALIVVDLEERFQIHARVMPLIGKDRPCQHGFDIDIARHRLLGSLQDGRHQRIRDGPRCRRTTGGVAGSLRAQKLFQRIQALEDGQTRGVEAATA